jgi:iron(III) transport system permease protein
VNSFRRHLDDLRLILRDPVLAATILLVAASLVLFILWPLYEVLWEGFFTEKGAFTLQYFRESLAKSENLHTLANTVWLGIFVSTISTFIGFLFAYADAFLKIRFKACSTRWRSCRSFRRRLPCRCRSSCCSGSRAS